MGLSDKERDIVVEHRLQRAIETLEEAKDLINSSRWNGAANRLYYACFYAVGALLVQNEIDAQTHSGTINQLGLHFVRNGLLSTENGKLYKRLFELRQTGDYSDWISIEEEDVKPFVEKAGIFINTIKQLILK